MLLFQEIMGIAAYHLGILDGKQTAFIQSISILFMKIQLLIGL